MDERNKQLLDINAFIEGVDQQLNDILGSLQWDQKYLCQSKERVLCKYNSNHKVPRDKIEKHEKECFLKSQGYSKDDVLLPDPPDSNAKTVIKLGKEDIKKIINAASNADPTFKRVFIVISTWEYTMPFKWMGPQDSEPMTLERLQSTYTVDERRAIYDAVVAASPACHDLSELALLSTNEEDGKRRKPKSRTEVLAELRDMKRRRTKYRVAAKTRNYSDVLRDVIRAQMEMYTETQDEPVSTIKAPENIRIKEEPQKYCERINTGKDHRNGSFTNDARTMKLEPSRNKHEDRNSKYGNREDSKPRYKYPDHHRNEDRSSQNFKETNRNSRSYYDNYTSKYRDNEMKPYKYKEEFRSERQLEAKSREKRDTRFEEHRETKKRHMYESGSKYKGRTEEKRVEVYNKDKYAYSETGRKDLEARYKRYYDTSFKEDSYDKKRKRNK